MCVKLSVKRERERNVLFNDTLNIFYYGYMASNIWLREREMFYLTIHSTHFIYGYMASDIVLRTILIVRKETRCHYIDYSYRLTARFLLYAPSHRQDSTYHSLCYTSCGALAGMRNSSVLKSIMSNLMAFGARTFSFANIVIYTLFYNTIIFTCSECVFVFGVYKCSSLYPVNMSCLR